MFGIGGSELLVIVFVALLVFGPGRLPEIARVIKRGYQEWAKLKTQVDDTITDIKQEIDLSADLDSSSIRSEEKTVAGTKPRTAAGSNPQPLLPVPDDDDYLVSGADDQYPELNEDKDDEDSPEEAG